MPTTKRSAAPERRTVTAAPTPAETHTQAQVGLQESLGNQATIGLLSAGLLAGRPAAEAPPEGMMSETRAQLPKRRHRAKRQGGGGGEAGRATAEEEDPALATDAPAADDAAADAPAAEPGGAAGAAPEAPPEATPPPAQEDEKVSKAGATKKRSKAAVTGSNGAARPAPPPVRTAPAPGGGAHSGESASTVASGLGAGAPLPATVRSRMERGLGQPLAGVRLHDDAQAHSLSRRLDARAVTVGQHVAFAPGQYRPGTLAGDALLAHELAHTVQQRGARDDAADGALSGAGYSALERDADSAGAAATAALWAPGALPSSRRRPRHSSGLRLSRCNGGGAKKTTTSALIGKHTTINFILDKKAPKRSNTTDSETVVGTETYKARVLDDAPNKQWKYQMHTIDSPGEMQIVYFTKNRYPAPDPTDDSGALTNVTKTNWKTIVKDLDKNKAGSPDFWSAYRAEDVHEAYHWEKEWQVDAKTVYPKAEKEMDALTVSKASANTAAKAEGKLKPKADVIWNKYFKQAATTFGARGDNAGDPPYQAQVPVVEALIKRVKAYAKKKGW